MLWGAAVCASLAWLMPTHELPWTAFHAELAMAMAALLGCTAILHALRWRIAAVPSLAVAAAAMAAIPLLQFLAGTLSFLGDAILASLYLLSFAAMVVAGHHASRLWSGSRVLEASAWTALLGAIASSAMALCQWLVPDDLPMLVNQLIPHERPYANLLQPNLLATLLVLGLLATACLFDRRRIGTLASVLLAGLLAFGLVLAQARVAWLELVVILALAICKRRAWTGRLGLRHLAVGVALLALAQLAWTLLDPMLGESVARDAVLREQSTGNRLIHWREMVAALQLQPWEGYGWMGSGVAQYAVVAGFPATHEVLAYSHNLVLDLLVWNGVPLGLAMVAWLCAWLWRTVRHTADSTTLLALAGLMAMLVHAQVEFPLAYTYFLLPAGMLCGLLCANVLPASVRATPVWVSPLLLCCATGVLVVVSLDYFAIEQKMRMLRFEQARIGLGKSRPDAAPIRMLTHLDAVLRLGRTPERENMTEAQLAEMRRVVARFPSGPNMVRLAAALALNQRPDESAQVLRRICKLETEPGCRNMQVLWAALAVRQPALLQVTWPAP